MPVFINNIQEKVEVGKEVDDLIEKAVATVLQIEAVDGNPEVSVSFVDDEYIRELNHKYRNKDIPTDVLSFPLIDEEEEMFEQDDEPEILLGDIIISMETALRQAEDYGHSMEREVAFLTVHGMLHLLGHDHYEEEETKMMRAKEEEAMEILQLSR